MPDEWPAVSQLPDMLIPEISRAMAQLQFDFKRLDSNALDAALIRHCLGVPGYAERLGYSESTLSRVCDAAQGRSAKQVIDRRVALEAARELVHSQASVAEVNHHLGFSEATNFVKFFRRMNGYSPQAFRNRVTTPWQLSPELPDL